MTAIAEPCAAANSSGLSCLLLPAEPAAQQSCQASAVSELGVVRRFCAYPVTGKQLTLGFGAALYLGTVWFADPFFLFLAFAPLICVGLPVAVGATIFLLIAIRTGRPRRPAVVMLGAVAALTILAGLAWPLNPFAQDRAVTAAKAYPERVAPLLEAYRQAHGAYPDSLDQLPTKPVVPRLLRRMYGYRSDGGRYSFSFPVPGGMIDSWDYDSDTKEWSLST